MGEDRVVIQSNSGCFVHRFPPQGPGPNNIVGCIQHRYELNCQCVDRMTFFRFKSAENSTKKLKQRRRDPQSFV